MTCPTHHWDKAQDGDFAEYLHKKAIPQLKELLNNYGEFPVVIWFDTPTEDMTPALAGEIVTLLNQHPNLIWNNRLGGGYKGDTDTPEQYIPAQGFPGRDWEACMTMNDTWGYKSWDTNFKSDRDADPQPRRHRKQGWKLPAEHRPGLKGECSPRGSGAVAGSWQMACSEWQCNLRNPCDVVRSGSRQRVSATEKDGEGKPKFIPSWKWRSTTTADKIFIEIFAWPEGSFHLDSVPRTVTGAYLLADPAHKDLTVTKSGSGVDIKLPAKSLDPIATVLVLKTE